MLPLLTFSLNPQVRPDRDGLDRSPREFLEFAADGSSLRSFIAPGDVVSVLDGGLAEQNRIEAMLLRRPSELPTGRVPLYVCPECGDVNCGAVAARIEETENAFVWSDFTVEVMYFYDSEDERVQKRIEDVGPLAFEKGSYVAALEGRLTSMLP